MLKMQPINALAKDFGVHVSTIFRWGSPKGVRGHRLRLTRIGGRTYVLQSDLETFLNALNERTDSVTELPQERMSSSRVEAELDAAGL